MILVTNIRIREGQLSFPVTPGKSQVLCCEATSVASVLRLCCDIAAVTIVKAKDSSKYLKEKIRLLAEWLTQSYVNT